MSDDAAPLLLIGTETAGVRSIPLAGGAAAAFTAPRPGREGPNEDAAAVVPLGEARGLLLIADGAGGHARGFEAARVAVETVVESVGSSMARDAGLRPCVLDGIERANERVSALGGGSATTIAAVEIEGATVRSYHVGDSEILVVGQRGRIRHQVVPHSPTGYAMEAGLLDEGEALVHQDRHLVSNLVGDADMRIDVGPQVTLNPRDTVLVASDGLFDNLRVEEIVEIVRKGPLVAAGRALAGLALERMSDEDGGAPGKPDDLTFLLYRPRTHRSRAG